MNPKAVAELRSIFEAAQSEIVATLANYQAWNIPGYELGRQRVLLKQVEEILDQMDGPALEWAGRWLPRAYNEGSLYATESLRALGVAEDAALRAGFSTVDVRQIESLAEFMVDSMDAMQAQVVSKLGTAIRNAQLPVTADVAAARNIAEGMVRGAGVERIRGKLLLEALNGQLAPGGYTGTLAQYAEVLARTRIAEAQTQGAIIRMTENGITLVKMSSHAGACPICRPWEGAVFWLAGDNPYGFPPLATMGEPPLHPNCAHRLVPFVWELARAEEREEANAATNQAMARAA